MSVKLDAPDVKGLFRQLAAFQEAFEAETECGLCNSPDIRFNVRVRDENEYFELTCLTCGGQFSFGQHKKGSTLFAKRKTEDGGGLPNRGWYKWQPRPKSEYSSSKPAYSPF